MNKQIENKPQGTRAKDTLGRQKRLIVVLAALAAVLAVAYIVVLVLDNGESLELPLYDSQGDRLEYTYTAKSGNRVEVTDQTDSKLFLHADSKISYNARPFIFPEISLDHLNTVTVENNTGTYSLYYDETSGEFLFKNNEMLLYHEKALAELMFQARYMLAIQKVDGTYTEESSLADFGLDAASKPVKVTVTDRQGHRHTVLFGDMLVTGAAYYAKDDSKPYVYVVDTSVSAFFKEQNSFFKPVIAPTFAQNEYQYMESFSIVKDGKPFLSSQIIPEDRREGTGNTYLHQLTFPAGYNASFEKYYEALESVGTLTGSRVVETGVLAGGEEYAVQIFDKYGLTVASNDVSYTFGNKSARFLTGSRFTDADGKTLYYAYSPYMDTVVELPLENAPFLEYPLIDFIDPSVFQMKIDHVSEITAHVPGVTCRFVLEGTGQDLKVIETTTGKTVDTPSFRQFYISLLTIRLEDYASAEQVTGTEEFNFTVKTVFGEELTYQFDVISTTRDLIRLNGSAEFYTNRSHITSAAERLIKLARGEIIQADY